MKTFVIGDIHGGYRALLQCLARSGFDKKKDTLICLGDVADGWSEVPECVEELLSIKNLINIRGNHDDWCYQWLKFGQAPTYWKSQGGQATFDAYNTYHPDLKIKHEKEFFSKQISYYIDDENRGFVHGGFTSRKGLGHEHTHTNYFWDRDLWLLAMMSNGKTHFDTDGAPQGYRFFKHHEVYVGHTATTQWKCKNHYPETKYHKVGERITVPMTRCNVWNLDTGGGWGGKLTIMDVDTKEFWQSDLVKDLYPEEKGR